MATDYTVQPIDLSDGDALKGLAAEARAEGYRFVDRLIDDWESGRNRFSEPGEKLLGVFAGGDLVAVGGLNRDPYVQRENVGRLRHIYVHPRCRRLGIGKLLVAALLKGLSRQFWKVCLRTDTAIASLFYEACGFRPSDESEATHERILVS